MLPRFFTWLLLLCALAVPALAEISAEFMLPLPGETVDTKTPGVLVRVPVTTNSVVFRLIGPQPLRVVGRPEGDGLFSARLPNLAEGTWQLSVDQLDARGKRLRTDSLTFTAQKDVPATIDAAEATPVDRSWNQSLYLSGNVGWRQGASEDALQSWSPIRKVPGNDVSQFEVGSNEVPFDRTLNGDITAIWDVRKERWKMRLRTTGDLGDRPGYTQEMNRYSLDLSYGPWASLHVGDQYPYWNPLLFDQSRVRGVGVDLTATSKLTPWLRVNGVWGWNRREQQAAVLDFGDSLQDTIAGSPKRYVQAVRIGTGNGQSAQFNFSWIHAIDDTSDLDMAVQERFHGIPPYENTALGTDFQWFIWKRRFEVYAQAATSLVTENIRLGTPVDSLLERTGFSGLFSKVIPITLNSTTRGVPRLVSDDPLSDRIQDFIATNSSARAGLVWNQALGNDNRMRNEVRVSHSGLDFESFLRSTLERPRTGISLNHSSGWLNERIYVSANAGLFALHRTGGEDLDEKEFSGSFVLSPLSGWPGIQTTGGYRTSQDPSGANSLSWNTGVSLYKPLRLESEASFHNTVSWQHVAAHTQSDSLALSKGSLSQNVFDISSRWKAAELPVELYLAHSLGISETNSSTIYASEDSSLMSRSTSSSMDNRPGLGMNWSFADGFFETGVSGSVLLHSDDVATELTLWEQSSRLQLNFSDAHNVRVTQNLTIPKDTQHDLRVALIWESYL